MKILSLNSFHESNGAKFSDFAGWKMPISYGSSIREHLAVRNNCALFDVSHMGEIKVHGPKAKEFLSFVLTQSFTNFANGTCRYSTMCDENGGTVDDLITYKYSDDSFLLCVNASNVETDFDHLNAYSQDFDCVVTNKSIEYGQLAVQGPKSEEIMVAAFGNEISKIKKMKFAEIFFQEHKITISRTGYTGEDGFEIYCNEEILEALAFVLSKLMGHNSSAWAGLAARDSLRLEAGFPLYGNELSREISPLQARVGWCVDLTKDQFVGKKAITEEKHRGVAGLVQFYKAEGRRIPRSGASVLVNDEVVGRVLSGGYSPSLEVPMGSVWIKSEALKETPSLVDADIGGRRISLSLCDPVIREIKKDL
jgi:aminomethyltransferase